MDDNLASSVFTLATETTYTTFTGVNSFLNLADVSPYFFVAAMTYSETVLNA